MNKMIKERMTVCEFYQRREAYFARVKPILDMQMKLSDVYRIPYILYGGDRVVVDYKWISPEAERQYIKLSRTILEMNIIFAEELKGYSIG